MIDRPGFAAGPRPSATVPPPDPHGAPRAGRTRHLAALRELTLARIRIMIREPEVVFWVFLFPVLLALGLGVAFSDPAAERYLVVVEAAVERGGGEGGEDAGTAPDAVAPPGRGGTGPGGSAPDAAAPAPAAPTGSVPDAAASAPNAPTGTAPDPAAPAPAAPTGSVPDAAASAPNAPTGTVPARWMDTDPAAEALAARLRSREGIEVRILGPAAAEAALRRGEAALVISASDGRTVRYDPSRPEGAQARAQVALALAQAQGMPLPELHDEPVLQRGSRYIDWLIPGLIGFNLMSTGLWAMAYYITQMRQSRQLKRLSATPMRRSHFLAAQLLARFSFLVVEVPVVVLFAWLIFGVEVVGSPISLAFVILLGAAAFSALGLLAATRARTVESASGIINLLLLPMTVVSGVFFSAARFPDASQPFIQALPLTALNEALRAIYNEGASLLTLGPEVGLLLAWTVVPFLLALKLFRWQ